MFHAGSSEPVCVKGKSDNRKRCRAIVEDPRIIGNVGIVSRRYSLLVFPIFKLDNNIIKFYGSRISRRDGIWRTFSMYLNM